MSEITLECKGLPCPQPVLKCKETIENTAPDRLVIIVDNQPAKENVSRFLGMQGYTVESNEAGSEIILNAVKDDSAACDQCEAMSRQELTDIDAQKILVFVAADTMGSGDDTLGASLMYNFLLTLKELGDDLWRVVMVNGGVKLSVPDNKCVEELKKLEENGVSLLVCGTCLEHFGLTGTQEVGQVTNMLDIVTSFQLATKTIRV